MKPQKLTFKSVVKAVKLAMSKNKLQFQLQGDTTNINGEYFHHNKCCVIGVALNKETKKRILMEDRNDNAISDLFKHKIIVAEGRDKRFLKKLQEKHDEALHNFYNKKEREKFFKTELKQMQHRYDK